jgi:hypothetical protein
VLSAALWCQSTQRCAWARELTMHQRLLRLRVWAHAAFWSPDRAHGGLLCLYLLNITRRRRDTTQRLGTCLSRQKQLHTLLSASCTGTGLYRRSQQEGRKQSRVGRTM